MSSPGQEQTGRETGKGNSPVVQDRNHREGPTLQCPWVNMSKEEPLWCPAWPVNHSKDVIQRPGDAAYVIPFKKTYFYFCA